MPAPGLKLDEAREQPPQQRDGRWVLVDLVGKGRRIRTVPIPPFVKAAIDAWTAAAGLFESPLFRPVRRRKYPEKTPAALSGVRLKVGGQRRHRIAHESPP